MDSKQFEIMATLDNSSSGTTKLARHIPSQKRYAIKILRKEFAMNHDLDNIFRSVNRHPFILGFEGSFESHAYLQIVMEFAAGGYLMWHLQHGEFESERTHLYAAELCLAIKFLHENGIVHRDLTLDNVMLDSDGHIKVTGYELCKGNIWHEYRTSTFCGTSGCPAPEVISNQPYGRAVDWWSFGIILYQMSLRQVPFPQEDVDETYSAILEHEPSYDAMSAEKASIIRELLKKNPDERLGSSVRDALDIMEHPFFKDIVWEDVHHKRIPVTFKPQLKDEEDFSQFDIDMKQISFIDQTFC